ncbi:MAG TPA: hypothetical protein VMH28_07435 [Candidatus Acidoferrales bacterium]|nr:hypothetical protein [Candidatus Acidoferrales bacterium]
MPFQTLAAAATLLTVAPHGNRIDLQLDRGSAEIRWVSAGTFRFRRVLEGPLPELNWAERDPVAVDIADSPDTVRLRSRALEIVVTKKGALLEVRRARGGTLSRDVAEPLSQAAGVTQEREAPAGSDFFGLGPRTDSSFSLAGKSLRAEIPFFVSTAGYGEYHAGAGSYHFDFAAAGGGGGPRYKIAGTEIDYFFYYGPTPKEIFEEHNAVYHTPAWTVAADRFGSWTALRAAMVRIVQGAMSAANAPLFDLAPYNGAPEELQTRARQLGSIVARVTPGTVGLSGLRKQLETFFGTYNAELQDRGFPVWHPLPFQFPDDPEGTRHTDEFMLGDEMLIAPICEPGEQRSVYLPRGIWTNLETDEVTQGPRTITVKTKSLPVFAKNGSIVPLNSGNAMALHYFPKSGGEFFLLEPDVADYSQVYAAPALDFVRLEIESKKDRDYQWVVHHLDKPSNVGFNGKPYRQVEVGEMGDRTWSYDPRTRRLQVRAAVKAGEDCIVDVEF